MQTENINVGAQNFKDYLRPSGRHRGRRWEPSTPKPLKTDLSEDLVVPLNPAPRG